MLVSAREMDFFEFSPVGGDPQEQTLPVMEILKHKGLHRSASTARSPRFRTPLVVHRTPLPTRPVHPMDAGPLTARPDRAGVSGDYGPNEGRLEGRGTLIAAPSVPRSSGLTQSPAGPPPPRTWLFVRPSVIRPNHPWKLGIPLILLLAALGLGGCSAVRIAYQGADVAVRHYADDYLNLDSERLAAWQPQLDQALARHRSEELPYLARFFEDALAGVSRGLDRTRVECLEEQFLTIYRRQARWVGRPGRTPACRRGPVPGAPPGGALPGGLGEAADLSAAAVARRERKRAQRYGDAASWWIGGLSEAQTALVRSTTAAMPDTAGAWAALPTVTPGGTAAPGPARRRHIRNPELSERLAGRASRPARQPRRGRGGAARGHHAPAPRAGSKPRARPRGPSSSAACVVCATTSWPFSPPRSWQGRSAHNGAPPAATQAGSIAFRTPGQRRSVRWTRPGA